MLLLFSLFAALNRIFVKKLYPCFARPRISLRNKRKYVDVGGLISFNYFNTPLHTIPHHVNIG